MVRFRSTKRLKMISIEHHKRDSLIHFCFYFIQFDIYFYFSNMYACVCVTLKLVASGVNRKIFTDRNPFDENKQYKLPFKRQKKKIISRLLNQIQLTTRYRF